MILTYMSAYSLPLRLNGGLRVVSIVMSLSLGRVLGPRGYKSSLVIAETREHSRSERAITDSSTSALNPERYIF